MRSYLLCEIHGERFAVDVERVEEVVRMPWVTALAETPADVRGVVNYRGNCIAVVDPALRLSGELSTIGLESHLVIVSLNEDRVALVVDRVEDLVHASCRALPDEAASPGFVVGHLDDDRGLATVVDVGSLLKPEVQDFVVRTRESEAPSP